MKKKDFLFDKIISKYQALSENEKSTIDFCLKGLVIVLSILLIYNIGGAMGEYVFNLGVKI